MFGRVAIWIENIFERESMMSSASQENTLNELTQIKVVSLKDLTIQDPSLISPTLLFRNGDPLDYSRVVSCQGEISGVFVVPKKATPVHDKLIFGFILKGNDLYFVEHTGNLKAFIEDFENKYELKEMNAVQVLMLLMNFMIQEDIYFLEDYNLHLEGLEEDIFEGRSTGMEQYVITARKDMNTLGNYYLQLSAAGEALQQAVIAQNESQEQALISLFLSRCNQLTSMVESVKDHVSQIWNLRQTKLSDKQNKISTLLTIITTLFLPLTLVTGWYGMNFSDMPLLHNSHGYVIVICFVLFVLAFEVHFIRERHWLWPDSSLKSTKEIKKNDKLVIPKNKKLANEEESKK